MCVIATICQSLSLQGILEAYHYALNHTELYGPTNFSSFLDKATESAKGSVTQESQNYYILLVITVCSHAHCVCVLYMYMYMYVCVCMYTCTYSVCVCVCHR